MLPNLNQPTRKWRRINPYICDKCGKPRYSFIFTRAKEKVCRSCARNQVPENQQSLFEAINDDNQKSKLNKQALGRSDYENKKLEKDIINIAFGRKKKKICSPNS